MLNIASLDYTLQIRVWILSIASLNYTLQIRVWMLSIAFTFTFGAMFSKTWRVHAVLATKKLERKVSVTRNITQGKCS
jgi:hypothetical protein